MIETPVYSVGAEPVGDGSFVCLHTAMGGHPQTLALTRADALRLAVELLEAAGDHNVCVGPCDDPRCPVHG